jgi:hypothetical protein
MESHDHASPKPPKSIENSLIYCNAKFDPAQVSLPKLAATKEAAAKPGSSE